MPSKYDIEGLNTNQSLSAVASLINTPINGSEEEMLRRVLFTHKHQHLFRYIGTRFPAVLDR